MSNQLSSLQSPEQGAPLGVAPEIAGLREQGQLLSTALGELESARAKLLQAHRLEAIGQLAAGIAHEINTPVQYVSDNNTFLERAFENLADVQTALGAVLNAARTGEVPTSLIAAADASIARSKFTYLLKQIPRALEQSKEGLGRISTIVQAMKEFSHPSAVEKKLVDLHDAIGTTVTVARNEWKYVADLELDFDDRLPQVPLHRNEFNQVILNLIVNAAHAIADVTKDGTLGKGKIRIATRQCGAEVEVRVSDTGGGIPEAVHARVFEPFFTTKAQGKGSGQGLAIAYSVIVDKHRGTIDFDSEAGSGTTFVIRLPLVDDSDKRSAEKRA